MPIRTQYESGQFCWTDLASHELDEAGEFYEDLLDWSRQPFELPEGAPRNERFMYGGHGAAGIGQMSAEMMADGHPPTWNSYLTVDEIDAVVQQAQKLGATVKVPPMDAADLGRLAFIEDPTGALFGVWQKGRHSGAELVGEVGTVFWNELQTRDSATAKQFYGSLFHWEFEDRSDEVIQYSLIRCGGEPNGCIVQMDERWGMMPSRWAVYFAVENVDISVDQVRQLGGMVYVPPFDYPLGRTAWVSDIQGAMFNLVQATD